MVPIPIRCRIPEHLNNLGKDRLWLQNKSGLSKQQLSDYVNMRYLMGLVKAKQIARLLKLQSSDELYEWVWREE